MFLRGGVDTPVHTIIKQLIFCCTGSQGNYFGLVSQAQKIIIISFRVSTSKNKNANHWVKGTCAIRSIQDETDHISLLCESMLNVKCTKFMVFYCNLKEKDHI